MNCKFCCNGSKILENTTPTNISGIRGKQSESWNSYIRLKIRQGNAGGILCICLTKVHNSKLASRRVQWSEMWNLEKFRTQIWGILWHCIGEDI